MTLAGLVDVSRGKRSAAETNAMMRCAKETREAVLLGHKIGQHKDVFDAPGTEEPDKEDLIRRRKEELTAELEALSERLNAG